MLRTRRKLAHATATACVVLLALTGVGQAAGGEPLPRPPRVWTSEATFIHGTYAILQGTVDPRGQITTYYFEWGKTSSYGKASAPSEEELEYRTEKVSEAIPRLLPHTRYHFRVVAHSRGGTSYGRDGTFRTRGRGTD